MAASSALKPLGAQDGAEQARARADVAADHHVLQRRHFGKQADVLEGAGNAGLGHLVHGGRLVGLAASSKLPLSGVYRPVITLKKVVLPAPLGPIRP
jgi:hypothetical protein